MPRKTPEGEFRNKVRTKLKLIKAVGEVIRTQGYTKLGVNNIAKTSGVNKKLIYRYFGTVDELIEIYVKSKDYWTPYRTHTVELNKELPNSELAITILEKLFNYFSENPEAQKIILWEISEDSKIMRDLSAVRERLGAELFKAAAPPYEETNIDIRAIYALLLGGIYYLVLHSNAVGGIFCEIDIKTEDGRSRILKSIHDVIDFAYAEAEKPKGGKS